MVGLQGGCVVRKAANDVTYLTYYYDYDQHPDYMY